MKLVDDLQEVGSAARGRTPERCTRNTASDQIRSLQTGL